MTTFITSIQNIFEPNKIIFKSQNPIKYIKSKELNEDNRQRTR